MTKTKLPESLPIPENKMVKLKSAGNVRNIKYVSRPNHKPKMVRFDKDHMINTETGDLSEMKHADNKLECSKSVRKSLDDLRWIINANVSDPKKLRWVTLTYAENMTDKNRLYEDCRRYHQKINRWCKSNEYDKPEYIDVIEPQARGAWHVHELMIWEDKAPFIPNAVLAEKWGQGFVQIKAVNEKCDNIGAYLTPYLTDLEIDPNTKDFDAIKGENIKEVEIDENGKKTLKKFIKGARLAMYPPGMRLYRTSRGVKKPTEEKMTYKEAIKKVSDLGGQKTYTSTVEIMEGDYNCSITNEYYNIARKESIDL